MADRSNAADLRPYLSVDAPPHPTPKDMQGSDNPIPLSPQWLLPKPADSKLGILSGEPHSSPHFGNHPDAGRISAIGEDYHDAGKRKDVFRPSSYDMESGRRDRWRDEERETQSAIRRDRWREAEKELGDTRKTERWSDNAARHLGEARRAPSERWTDSGNRDNSYDQRRENKWNTRWGPDEKESENRREKWSDASRGYEDSRDKSTSQLSTHGKDIPNQEKDMDREGEQSRSWRSNTFLARGRGDSSLPHPLTPHKQAPPFGYGRGKGENGGSVFSASRGRVDTNTGNGTSRSYPLGFTPEKLDGAHGDPHTLRYSRMKLLDVYRMTDLKGLRISLEEFMDVPSLTIPEPLEPLALSAPTPEELVTLKGIDKGDIVSSGLPQVSKEGSTGKNSADSMLPKQRRLGSREDAMFALGDYKDAASDNVKDDHSNYLESPSYGKYSHQHGIDSKAVSSHSYQDNKLTAEALRPDTASRIIDEMGAKEISMTERSASLHSSPWRSQSSERSQGSSLNWQDYSTDPRSRTSDLSGLHSHRNPDIEQKNITWQNNDLHSEQKNDFKVRRQSSESLDRDRENTLLHRQEDPFISRDRSAGKFSPSLSPEELSLHYKDPQGRIQGPFSGSDLIGWFEAGYFGIDLQVRIASAPADAPFSLLGDVMPHLKAKTRPPPGFGAAKQNDTVEVSNRGMLGMVGNAHPAIGEFEAVKNIQRNRHEATTEAENRFIESLISGNLSSSSSEHYSFVEGMKGYNGTSVRPESMNDMNYVLAQRMSLERQRSMPTANPYWSGRDASSIGSKPDTVPESPSTHSKFLPHVGDASRQIPQSPQVDLLSMLQAAADKSSSALNSGPTWPNIAEVPSMNNLVHGGMDAIKDKMDIHHNQHIASQTGFGAQHQRSHLPPPQPALSHLLGQPSELSSAISPHEKMLASEISQDPQLLGLLQQQYLMSQIQLHSQSSLPSQLSLFDKYLFLKQQQQQKQEQQQQLLQQQQQLLAQVLSGHQPQQYFSDLSFGHLKASVPGGSAPVDHPGIHQMHEALKNSQQMPVLNPLDGHSSSLSNLNVQGPKDVSYPVSTGPSPPHLPHQMFDHTSHPEGWDAKSSREAERIPNFDPEPTRTMAENMQPSELIGTSAKDVLSAEMNVLDLNNNAVLDRLPNVNHTNEKMTPVAPEAVSGSAVLEGEKSDAISDLSEKLNKVHYSLESIPDKLCNDAAPVKDVEEVEVKEPKKTSEKKSRKQKNAKTQLVSEPGKGPTKPISNQQVKADFEMLDANISRKKAGLQVEADELLHIAPPVETGASFVHSAESLDSQHDEVSSFMKMTTNEVGFEGKAEWEDVGLPPSNSQTTSSQRAWKPAPGLKPKSLLEIQQEEKRRVQSLQTDLVVSETSAAVVPTISSRTPWVGVVANSEHHSGMDIIQNPSSAQAALGNSAISSITSRSRKSQLHDLLAEEVLAKSNEGDKDIPDEKGSSVPPLPQLSAQSVVQSFDDDFVEAKDTKKSRKKAAKAAKAAGLKASPPVASAYLSAPIASVDKSKSTRQAQQEKEVLPVPPAGPSLGDFVLWKGDQTNSSPAPAWSSDSAKNQKPTSLRDILREQEKKSPSVQQQMPIPAPPKVQSNRANRASASSWLVPGSSPSKVSSSSQTKAASLGRPTSLTSGQSKTKTEDDLFWGPLDQSKQESKQSDFPSLANPSSLAGRGSFEKLASGGGSSNRQKSTGVGFSSSASGQPSSKGKTGATSKHSEAMDFRDWCESELVKLTGTNDTSFLEFCLKQSTAEAEMLLRENLGSLDHNHEFIDKFINYKDFLSADVMEMAFGAQNSVKSSDDTLVSKGTRTSRDTEADVVGKKKGKKGKKVNPAVLGFNVVSNRIMMGEIQTIED